MPKAIVFAAVLLIGTPTAALKAQVANQSTAQHAGACDNALVCATMKDGRSVAVTDCRARKEGAVRYLYGDCHDED